MIAYGSIEDGQLEHIPIRCGKTTKKEFLIQDLGEAEGNCIVILAEAGTFGL
jgi:hypothetical protein